MGAAIKLTTHEDNNNNHSLIWLDSLVNKSEENLDGQKSIQSSIDHLKTFENIDKCEEYIRTISEDERIILIVSGRLGREITPRIHQLRQVSSIYVYCLDKLGNEQWAKQYKKIKGIVTKFTNLIERIRVERSKRNQNEVNEPFSISIYQANTYQEHFIYFQLLIDIILRSRPMDNDKNRFILYCKEKYHNIDNELQLIEEFQNNYTPSQALDWYMKDSFLYRIINRIFRLQNLDIIFFCRFFIQDIRQAIKQNKCTTSIRVYRSQLMTKEDIQFLENIPDCLISVNSFLSTSIHRELALVFLQQSSSTYDLERVLRAVRKSHDQVEEEIDAEPSLNSIKPFGFIKSNNSIRQTEEVVFTLGSIFRLINIHQESDGMWIINLRLCTDDDQEIQDIFQSFRINQKNEQLNFLSFGNFLRKIGQINEAEKFFGRLLYELYGNNQYTADCYHALGCIAMEKELYDLSLNWHQKSLEIKLQIFKEDDINLADSYNSIGQIYVKKLDYKQALASYLRALKIIMQINGENHPNVAACYTNIGGVYQKQEKYSCALECHQKAFTIYQKIFSVDHSDLGISHNNLAIIYSCRGQYDLALEHYNTALKILQNTLPSLHPEIAVSYCGLGLIYEQKGQLETALSYYEKTAVIYRQALSLTHPDVIQIERHIQRILSKLL